MEDVFNVLKIFLAHASRTWLWKFVNEENVKKRRAYNTAGDQVVKYCTAIHTSYFFLTRRSRRKVMSREQRFSIVCSTFSSAYGNNNDVMFFQV